MTASLITWSARIPTPFGWYVDSDQPHSGFSITHNKKAGRFVLGQADESAGRKNHCVVSGFDSLHAAVAEAERIVRGMAA